MKREQNPGSQSDGFTAESLIEGLPYKEQDIKKSEKEKLELKDQENKVKQKEEYPEKFLNLAKFYLGFVGLVIIASGTSYHPFNFFSVSDRVILTLLGTSLASILIPIQLFAKYLFAQSKDDNS